MWNAAKTLFTPTTANLTKHSETRSLKEYLKKSRFRTIFSQIKNVDLDLLKSKLSAPTSQLICNEKLLIERSPSQRSKKF